MKVEPTLPSLVREIVYHLNVLDHHKQYPGYYDRIIDIYFQEFASAESSREEVLRVVCISSVFLKIPLSNLFFPL
jgi:hypothetical protein